MEEGQATLIQAFQSNKQFRKSFPDSLGRAPATPHPSKDFHQEGRDQAGQAEGMSTVRAGIRAPGTWLLQLQGCSAEPVRENSWGLGGGGVGRYRHTLGRPAGHPLGGAHLSLLRLQPLPHDGREQLASLF